MLQTGLYLYQVRRISRTSLRKDRIKAKTYVFPCGETRKVQGYEPHALDELVQQGYTAKDIVTDCNAVPVVWWYDDDGKVHRYFVDIFIPSENRMIEVKSTYTYAMNGVNEKAQASREAGYVYDIWVYNEGRERTGGISMSG